MRQHKKTWWLAVSLVTCLVAYTGYIYWKSLAIYPKEVVEGYVDYTLVDNFAPSNGVLGTKFHREEWQLRFPKEMLIEVSERYIGSKKSLTNNWITFYLNLSSLSILPKSSLSRKDNVASVTIDSKKINYGFYDKKSKLPFNAPTGFLASIYGGEACLDGDEVYPGIFMVREANAEEKREIFEGRNINLQGCLRASTNNVPFRYYDESGRPKAYGGCTLSLGNVDKVLQKDSHCRWRIWLNQRRRLYLNLAYGQFKLLPQVIKILDERVNQASVKIHGNR